MGQTADMNGSVVRLGTNPGRAEAGRSSPEPSRQHNRPMGPAYLAVRTMPDHLPRRDQATKPLPKRTRPWCRAFVFLTTCIGLVTYFAYSELEQFWFGTALVLAGTGVCLLWRRLGK
jgi:hypothetical protein